MTSPDPHALATTSLSQSDPRLASLIASVGPCTLGQTQTGPFHIPGHFEALVESIVSQQLSVKAADTIYKRILALGPNGTLPPPADLLLIPTETLRAAGLSFQKISYTRDLCTKIVDKTIILPDLEHLPDEDVIQTLRLVKGIGRWTAEMFLIFRLGRPDILPVADLGIQQGIKKLYNLKEDPKPERMEKIAKPWRPYRSIACWYLWRHHERTKIAKPKK